MVQISKQYIACFWDLKGNIGITEIKGKRYYKLRMYRKGMLGKMIFEKFRKFLRYGNIYYKEPEDKETIYEFVIGKKEDIQDFKSRIGIFSRLNKIPAEVGIF